MVNNRGLFHTFTASIACASFATASTISLPLYQGQSEINPIHHALHTANKYGKRSLPVAPEVLDGGFWYGQLAVGTAKNLSLVVDTGSFDIGINPGSYKPSSASKKLGTGGNYHYITVFENGCGVSNISYQGYNDTVSFQGLTSKDQGLYHIKKQNATQPGTVTQLPRDGVVGFSMTRPDQFGTPFFYNLCKQKQVKECRFGLAFNTNNTGRQILGGIDTNAYTGSLTRFPVEPQWESIGNIAVKGKALYKNVSIVFDSGTAGVVGPADQIRGYFKAAGIQAVSTNLPGCVDGVFGYYACDKPPSLGFQLGSKNTTFDILPSAMKLKDNGNNNCTVWVTGLALSELQDNFWIVGQNWMQGKYIDHDYSSNTLGIGHLKK